MISESLRALPQSYRLQFVRHVSRILSIQSGKRNLVISRAVVAIWTGQLGLELHSLFRR
jgi:hypothetical protein